MNSTIVNLPHTRPLIAKKNHNGGKLPKKVAVLYTEANEKFFSTYEEYLTVKGSYEEALTFEPYFKKLGVHTCYIQADVHMTKNLLKYKPDMALNLVTTVKGYDYLASSVPAALEMLEIPYTGSTILGFALGCNKYLINCLLVQHGIPVPRYQLMTSPRTPLDPSLRFPLILKLNEEHSKVEITTDSVVEDEKQLRKRIRYLMKTYYQDVLVSEFIEGREFAAYLFQSYNHKVYTTEKVFTNQDRYKFIKFDMIWRSSSDEYSELVHNAKYHDPYLDAMIKKAFVVAKMDDYAKIEVRMDNLGNYYVIDANCNCYLSPSTINCDFTYTMKMYGIPFKILLKRLLQNTMREWGY